MDGVPFWLFLLGLGGISALGGIGLGVFLLWLKPAVRSVFSWMLTVLAAGMLWMVVYEWHLKDRQDELPFVAAFPHGCEGVLLDIFDPLFARRMTIGGCRVSENQYVLWDPACQHTWESIGLLGDMRVQRIIESPKRQDILNVRAWEREPRALGCET